MSFDLIDASCVDRETITDGKYIYRALATNRHNMTNDAIIHWYNERAEASENRIKDLKEDFGADKMPCQDFKANALYFEVCALAYNLFVLLRMTLPIEFESSRAKKVRYHLYNLVVKVVKSGRKIVLKVAYGSELLQKVVQQIKLMFAVPT